MRISKIMHEHFLQCIFTSSYCLATLDHIKFLSKILESAQFSDYFGLGYVPV